MNRFLPVSYRGADLSNLFIGTWTFAQFKVRWASDTIVPVRVVRKSFIGASGECTTYPYALGPRVGCRNIAARPCACTAKVGESVSENVIGSRNPRKG